MARSGPGVVSVDRDGADVAGPDAEAGNDERPSLRLFDAVVDQSAAVEQLRAAARHPVHAYLLVGSADLGSRALARAFAAVLLCPYGGCGRCDVCRRVLAGVHPDLVEVERAGAALSVGDAAEVVRVAQRRPLEAGRQVLVVGDLHLARLSAPVLLKTLEEPPGPTVFVLLADIVAPDLATVASRCVRVDLRPVPTSVLVEWLEDQGIAPAVAAEVAEAAAGNPTRAQLLAHDPDFSAHRALWASVPGRLDGTGAAAGALAAELVTAADQAVEPVRDRHRQELERRRAEAEVAGERAGSSREIQERHRREERRQRTDEIRAGLAILVGEYRDRLVTQAAAIPSASDSHFAAATERARLLADAVAHIETLAAELVRNPNETLQLEALLVRLSSVPG
jgi:DNA polymerase III subunit delta'